MDPDDLGAGLAKYLETNDDPGPFLAAVDVLYSDEFREGGEDTDDPALFAAAIDETLFYSDEALKRADDALELVAEAARRRVIWRREREFKIAVIRLRGRGHMGARVRVTVPTRSSRRESHGLNAGHRRSATRSSATSGDSGDDDPAEPAPALALAPPPKAILTFGVPRCPECGGVLLFASGLEICANRRCSRWGWPA